MGELSWHLGKKNEALFAKIFLIAWQPSVVHPMPRIHGTADPILVSGGRAQTSAVQ